MELIEVKIHCGNGGGVASGGQKETYGWGDRDYPALFSVNRYFSLLNVSVHSQSGLATIIWEAECCLPLEVSKAAIVYQDLPLQMTD